jgi:hypothetical protein
MTAKRALPAFHCVALSATLLFLLSTVAAAAPDVPPYETGNYQGTPWVSGGAGVGSRDAMLEKFKDDYNLKLEFAVTDGNYLGDIQVTINTPDGGTVVSALSKGPWFMVSLPPGTYDVQASGYERTFTRSVTVPASGLETVIFNQWTKEGIAARTPGSSY